MSRSCLEEADGSLTIWPSIQAFLFLPLSFFQPSSPPSSSPPSSSPSSSPASSPASRQVGPQEQQPLDPGFHGHFVPVNSLYLGCVTEIPQNGFFCATLAIACQALPCSKDELAAFLHSRCHIGGLLLNLNGKSQAILSLLLLSHSLVSSAAFCNTGPKLKRVGATQGQGQRQEQVDQGLCCCISC